MLGAQKGLLLWYQVVLPSQFPFVAGVSLLLQLQSFSRLPPALVCFTSGLISGYPVGAMTAGKLCENGSLSPQKVTALAAFSNMAGPLFVVGTVGVGLLENSSWGYLLLLVHWVSAASLLLFSAPRKMAAGRERMAQPAALKRKPIGQMLGDAVGDTAELMLKVGGFITLFSVILQWTPGYAGCLLEMTNGLKLIAGTDLMLRWKLVLCSFLIGFSGVCVLLQSLTAVGRAPVRPGLFLGCKLAQGIWAAVLMWGFCQILGV